MYIGRIVAAAGILFISPILVAAALAVALETGAPVFFRQKRIGRNGAPFQLLKFRTMRTGQAGAKITAANDNRITRVGALLRRHKIDELPQLWNVLRGDMNLVGPRPEVPEYVDLKDPIWNEILQIRPGISDLATLVYRDEEKILGSVANPERYYRDVVLPGKLSLSLHYVRTRSVWTDLRLLAFTVRYSFVPYGFDPQSIKQQFCCEENQ
jgi:lipopolysaccharide/colanic/teichoic acid biosynthesis glycosyltransferase